VYLIKTLLAFGKKSQKSDPQKDQSQVHTLCPSPLHRKIKKIVKSKNGHNSKDSQMNQAKFQSAGKLTYLIPSQTDSFFLYLIYTQCFISFLYILYILLNFFKITRNWISFKEKTTTKKQVSCILK
jgi:hypothetical protein